MTDLFSRVMLTTNTDNKIDIMKHLISWNKYRSINKPVTVLLGEFPSTTVAKLKPVEFACLYRNDDVVQFTFVITSTDILSQYHLIRMVLTTYVSAIMWLSSAKTSSSTSPPDYVTLITYQKSLLR